MISPSTPWPTKSQTDAQEVRALLREALPYLQSLARLVNNNRSLSMPKLPDFIHRTQCALDRTAP